MDAVDSALKTLSSRERQTLEWRNGLDNRVLHSFEEIDKHLPRLRGIDVGIAILPD